MDSGFVPSPVATEEKLRHPEFVRFARHELVDKLAKSLAGRREICEAYLFGSQALGTAQDHSDVDVAVYVDPATDLNRGFGIDAEIATDLMRALGCNEVDVVLLNRADPVLYHRVLRDGIRVLSRNLKDSTGREGYALSRYCDFVPQLGKIRAAATSRSQRGDFGR